VRDLVDERGLTAIIVTHDLDDLAELADHVVLYEPGRSLSTHELQRGDRSSAVAALGLNDS
jgi:ABC-type sulfate/molybdate transport systems ATPase subunit